MNRHLLCFVLVSLGLAAVSRAEGPFFELDGFNGFYGTGGVPDEAFKLLKLVQGGNKEELKCFAFAPGGEWVFLFGGDGYYTSNTGLPACKKLTELQKGGKHSFKCIAFAPGGGWTIFWDQNGNWTEGGVPDDAFKRIVELAKKGEDLRSVAYGPHGSWVVLFGKTGVYFGGVPEDLAKVLSDAVKNGTTVLCVAFTGNDWVCLTNNGWWTSNLSLPSAKLIDQNIKHKYSPKWLAVVPTFGPHNWEKFAEIVHHALDGKLAGGYAFEVLDHGKVVAKGTEGWARAPWEADEPSVKWTLEKPMDVASVSKTITATALLKLWEECEGTNHKFSLDDPFWPHIKHVCPTASAEVKRITLRQLLTHKSGFKNVDSYLTAQDLEKLLNLPLAHRPGTFFEYENNNYFILHFVIEDIAKTQYTPYVKDHVLKPMGITHMETHLEAEAPTLAYGKPDDKRPGALIEQDCTSFAGAGGWFGSVSGLGKFLVGLGDHKVLSAATTDLMLKENFGWDYSDPGWAKGGLLVTGDGQSSGSTIAHFSDGVDAVILINCVQPANIEDLMSQAWTDARGK